MQPAKQSSCFSLSSSASSKFNLFKHLSIATSNGSSWKYLDFKRISLLYFISETKVQTARTLATTSDMHTIAIKTSVESFIFTTGFF